MFSKSEVESRVMRFFGKNSWDLVWPEEAERVRVLIENLCRSESCCCAPTMSGVIEGVAPKIGEGNSLPVETELLLALNGNPVTAGMAASRHSIGPYRIGLAFADAKLAVECDNRDYKLSPGQSAIDQHRDDYLSHLGWTVLRFGGSEVQSDAVGCAARVALVYAGLKEIQGVR